MATGQQSCDRLDPGPEVLCVEGSVLTSRREPAQTAGLSYKLPLSPIGGAARREGGAAC